VLRSSTTQAKATWIVALAWIGIPPEGVTVDWRTK
jgi:hypothetical protein